MTAEILDPLKVIFLLGARGAGKSTAALQLAEHAAGGPFVLDGFNVEPRERCHAAYKIIDMQSRLPAPSHQFEDALDTPHDAFVGLSPRNAYIRFDRWLRDAFPKGTLGVWLAERCRYFQRVQKAKLPEEKRARTVIVHDEGTQPDYEEAVKIFGAAHCSAIHIKRADDKSAAALWTPQIAELVGGRVYTVENPGDHPSKLEKALRQAAPLLFLEIAKEIVE